MREIFVRILLLCGLCCSSLFIIALPGLATAAPARDAYVHAVKHAQPISVSKVSSVAKAPHIQSNGLHHTAAPVGPDLALSLSANASNYTVGQVITYTLVVTDNATAASVSTGVPIIVTDVLPLGLNSIAALALPSQWSFSLSSATGPSILTATYTGLAAVTPGISLPVITLFGVLTPAAQGVFSNTASVSVAGDLNLADNIATLSVSVSPVTPPTATATIVPTATATVVPTATATIVPTATATVVPTPTATVVPTATATIVPTATATATPVATLPPDLGITQSFANSTSIQVGQPVALTLTISNTSSAGTVPRGATIQVNDILPLGFNQIVASGNDWFTFTTSSTGPSLLSAVYTSPILINPGAVLPPIVITGTLDANILPSLINTASVSTNGTDVDPTNNASTAILTVIPAPTPDLHIAQTILGPVVRVISGQPFSIAITTNNVLTAGPLERANTVTVYDVLPSGLSQITAMGNNWFILLTSTNGPAFLTAIYFAPTPLLAGQALPVLTIRGIVNANVGSSTLTNTAVVSAPGDLNTTNNNVTTTVSVYLPTTPTVPVPVITPTVPVPVITPSVSAFSFRERNVYN